jgi:cell division protein ZapA (FtsZ GTPase activity inhibitor)
MNGCPARLAVMTATLTLDDLHELAARVETAERALDDARLARDEGIREVRLQTRHTVAEIAEAAGISVATVKAVTRGLR